MTPEGIAADENEAVLIALREKMGPVDAAKVRLLARTPFFQVGGDNVLNSRQRLLENLEG